MAWCHQASSHYLSQCLSSYMTPYSITRPQWVNPWHDDFFMRKETYICTEICSQLNPFHMKDSTFILHGQYHGHWWFGNAKSQGISSPRIDLVLPEYAWLSTWRLNHLGMYKRWMLHLIWTYMYLLSLCGLNPSNVDNGISCAQLINTPMKILGKGESLWWISEASYNNMVQLGLGHG